MADQGEYVPSPHAWARQQVAKYEATDGLEGGELRGRPVVILTTIGAQTGHVRKSPVMRVESDGQYGVVASVGGADEHPMWYGNILANPIVELQDGPIKQVYMAHEATGAERVQWWARAVEAWPDYAKYQTKTQRVIPVMVLVPKV